VVSWFQAFAFKSNLYRYVAVYNVLAQLVSKDGAHPIVFSFYRDIIAAPILVAAAWYFDGGIRFPRSEDVPRIVAQGERGRGGVITLPLISFSALFVKFIFPRETTERTSSRGCMHSITALSYTPPLHLTCCP
jgi:hypothetical protein